MATSEPVGSEAIIEEQKPTPGSAECSPKKGKSLLCDSSLAYLYEQCFCLVGQATLSTSTSSYEPLETHDPTLNRLAVTMFQKVSDYLQAELTSSESEYQLLEQMNKVTSAKYKDLKQIAISVGKGMEELNEKCTTTHNLVFSIFNESCFYYS